MEWLFSHPEETQEDDELARALAMSFGNSRSDTKEEVANESIQPLEGIIQLAPVEDLLSTRMKLPQTKEPQVFPVRDLLVTICSQNDGQYKSSVITFIIDRMKLRGLTSESGNESSSHCFLNLHVQSPFAAKTIERFTWTLSSSIFSFCSESLKAIFWCAISHHVNVLASI